MFTSGVNFFGQRTDPAFGFVRLLIHASGANNSTTFTDSSNRHVSITGVGGAHINTSTKPVGSGSVQFNGTTDALSCAYDVETNVFYQTTGPGYATLELFVKTTSTGNFTRLVERTDNSASNGSWLLYINDGAQGSVGFEFAPFSTATSLLTSGNVNINDNNWHHVAVTRSVSTWRLFVDGILKDTKTSSSNQGAPITPLLIGKSINLPRWLNGYVAEIRLTGADPAVANASLACRYTTNFTVPTLPFPNSG